MTEPCGVISQWRRPGDQRHTELPHGCQVLCLHVEQAPPPCGAGRLSHVETPWGARGWCRPYLSAPSPSPIPLPLCVSLWLSRRGLVLSAAGTASSAGHLEVPKPSAEALTVFHHRLTPGRWTPLGPSDTPAGTKVQKCDRAIEAQVEAVLVYTETETRSLVTEMQKNRMRPVPSESRVFQKGRGREELGHHYWPLLEGHVSAGAWRCAQGSQPALDKTRPLGPGAPSGRLTHSRHTGEDTT